MGAEGGAYAHVGAVDGSCHDGKRSSRKRRHGHQEHERQQSLPDIEMPEVSLARLDGEECRELEPRQCRNRAQSECRQAVPAAIRQRPCQAAQSHGKKRGVPGSAEIVALADQRIEHPVGEHRSTHGHAEKRREESQPKPREGRDHSEQSTTTRRAQQG